ncbi:MAG: hypothetical protein K9W42_08425 [Candidatus Heimdallarchaeota archaeon]|nr:hypothetical protein [Candidatus Heimdallarchaeota archaeon]
MLDYFTLEIDKIQPSQLYISKRKLKAVQKVFDPLDTDLGSFGVIPIKELNGEIIFVDGHTRALVAYLTGMETINVVWETDELDWEMYEICVQWCKEAGILSIADLESRIIPHDDYEILWYKRCKDAQQKLAEERKKQDKIKA